MNLFVAVSRVSVLEPGAQDLAAQSSAACKIDLHFRYRHSLPYVHPLGDGEQHSIDVPELVETVAMIAQVTKKGTPLFGKAAGRVNPNRITAFHELVEHLADSLE